MKQRVQYIRSAAILSLSALLFGFCLPAKTQVIGCQAAFTFTVTGATASFTNTSMGGMSPNYMWNFGDGTYSFATNPVHTYSANGTYNVCLTLWDSLSNCQSTYCRYVTISNSTSTGCTVSFTSYPDSSQPNLVHFYGTSPGMAVSWSWTFGDGGTASVQNPSHQYNAAGTYIVCVKIKTPMGDSCSYCDSVVVGPVLPNNCTAGWTNTTTGMNVNFTNTSAGGTVSTGYYWDFGDGGTSTLVNPSHTYSFSGTYTVCLTMYDQNGGCYDVFCDTVKITSGNPPPCNAMFYAYPDSNMMPGSYSFVDFSSGNPIAWYWTFGDGGTSTQQNPSHTYMMPGTYTVCLTINTVSSGSCTVCDTIQYKITNTSTGIIWENGDLVLSLTNYPNPFSVSTAVAYSLEQSGLVELSVCDVTGRTVAVLMNGNQTAGAHRAEWTPGDIPAGIYWLKLTAGENTAARKLVLIR